MKKRALNLSDVLPKRTVDHLSLQYHTALAVLRSGAGGTHQVQFLITIHLHTLQLAVVDVLPYPSRLVSAVEQVLHDLLASIKRGERPHLTVSGYCSLCELVTLHDRQLVFATGAQVVHAHRVVENNSLKAKAALQKADQNNI